MAANGSNQPIPGLLHALSESVEPFRLSLFARIYRGLARREKAID